MANIKYTISLGTKGSLNGDYYTVQYTTASVYNTVPTGSPAYLPSIGSTATVEIPSGSISYLAFRLTASSSFCSNTVTQVVNSGSGPSCITWYFNNSGDPGDPAETFNYINCSNVSSSVSVAVGSPTSVCVKSGTTPGTGSLGDNPFTSYETCT
jgi:hypothetical protein